MSIEISNKMSFAIIGLGYWGKNILRVLESLSDIITIKYLCDVFSICLEPYKNKYNCITDYNIILEDNEISSVFIITPIQTHFNIIIECISAGKNVYVEKPICMTSRELKLIKTKSIEMDKKVYCDYTFTHSDKIKKLKDIIQREGIENILYIEMRRESFGKTVQSGVIYDLLPHDISILLILFSGKYKLTELQRSLELLDYKKIYHNNLLFKSTLSFRINTNADTNADINSNINKGVCVLVNLSSLNEQKIRTIKIYLRDKIIEYDDLKDVIQIFNYHLSRNLETGIIKEERQNTEEITNINYNEPLTQSIKTFIEIIKYNLDKKITKYEDNCKMNEIITSILEKTI